MIPKNPIVVDGKGNLAKMIYGYSNKAEQILDKMGKRFLELIRQEFDQGGELDSWSHWPKLHPMTVQFKAGGGMASETLKETGYMEQSFKVIRLSKTLIWLGSEDPKAIIHEHGMFIKITSGMRGVFSARGFPLKKSTTWMSIPGRRMLAPVLKRLDKEFPKVFMKEMKKLDFAPVKITPV